jgi:hypothetical protein
VIKITAPACPYKRGRSDLCKLLNPTFPLGQRVAALQEQAQVGFGNLVVETHLSFIQIVPFTFFFKRLLAKNFF